MFREASQFKRRSRTPTLKTTFVSYIKENKKKGNKDDVKFDGANPTNASLSQQP